MSSRRAAGFPEDAWRSPVPDVYFSRDLPRAHSLEEVKVFLHLLWRIHRRPRTDHPALRLDDLAADTTLVRSLAAARVEQELVDPAARAGATLDVVEVLRRALDSLVSQGVVVDALADDGRGRARWLWINDPIGRRSRARFLAGNFDIDAEPVLPAPETPDSGVPNIFTLYQDNIGPLTPLLAEELAEAQALYPLEWIEDAFRQAVQANVRKWAYTRAILERWARDGRGHEADRQGGQTTRTRYLRGPYSKYVEH